MSNTSKPAEATKPAPAQVKSPAEQKPATKPTSLRFHLDGREKDTSHKFFSIHGFKHLRLAVDFHKVNHAAVRREAESLVKMLNEGWKPVDEGQPVHEVDDIGAL